MSSPVKLTQKTIAEHLDMSGSNLRDVLNRLGIDWKASDLETIRVAYIRHLRKIAAGHDDQLGMVRARRELADARLKELELAQEYKLIVRTADLEPMLIELMTGIQSAVLASGHRALQAIETEHDLKIDDDLILEPLRAALRNLAASGDQFISTFSGEPCASISGATGPSRGVDREQPASAGGQ